MKTYEVDVEMRVRKTLLIAAVSESAARDAATYILRSLARLRFSIGSTSLPLFYKWTDGLTTVRHTPVETILDADPQIVDVREAAP